MLHRAGDGAGDHELPKVEAVVGRDGEFWVEVRRLRDRPEVWILEFGCGVCGHGDGGFGERERVGCQVLQKFGNLRWDLGLN